jgi:hypothetical protein
MARESPWDMKNWADSAAQAIRKDPPTMEGKVHRAESAPPFAAAANPTLFMTGLLMFSRSAYQRNVARCRALGQAPCRMKDERRGMTFTARANTSV